jgi:TBC1 domain family protein 5
MHYDPNSRFASRPATVGSNPAIHPKSPTTITAATAGLEMKISLLEERNKALASTLREALDAFGAQMANVTDLDTEINSAMKDALAKAESVQACLQDSSLAVSTSQTPLEIDPGKDQSSESQEETNSATSGGIDILVNKAQSRTLNPAKSDETEPSADSGTSKSACMATTKRASTGKPTEAARAIPSRTPVRPSLTDSGFSWMLGGSRNLSGFVSSSPPPEQTRHLDQSRGKPSGRFGSGGEDHPGTDAEHGELALHSLRGSRDPLSGVGPL